MSQSEVPPAGEQWNRYRSCFFCYHPREGEIFNTEFHSVVFDDSPIIEGHVMIHTREHWGCAGELPPNQFEDLVRVKEVVKLLLRQLYGRVVFYEHGRVGHCSTWAGGPECDHFHLHALPADITIEPVLASRFRRVDVPEYGRLPAAFESHGEYLYFEDADGKVSVFPTASEVESHALRTMIANAIGDPTRSNWDGMRNPNEVEACRRKVEQARELLGEYLRQARVVAR